MSNTSFSERLRNARVLRGLSQTDLAGMANIAPGQVNRYESGKNMPRPHILAKLAAALGVFPVWLEHGFGDRDTGSSVAHHPEMDVSYRERLGGGADIAIDVTEELFQRLSLQAKMQGLDVDDYVKSLLVDNLTQRANAGMESVVAKLQEIRSQRDEMNALLKDARKSQSSEESLRGLAAEVLWLDHEVKKFEKLIQDYFPEADASSKKNSDH